MTENWTLRALRIPAGWTVLHNSLFAAPLDHPFWEHAGAMLITRHADADLTVEMTWDPQAGGFLVRAYPGNRRSRPVHSIETRDTDTGIAEFERLLETLVWRGNPLQRNVKYTDDDMETLICLKDAMLDLRRENPAVDQMWTVAASEMNRKLIALAPLVERFWHSLGHEDLERFDSFDGDFIPQVVRLHDWSGPGNEAASLAALNAAFRGKAGTANASAASGRARQDSSGL